MLEVLKIIVELKLQIPLYKCKIDMIYKDIKEYPVYKLQTNKELYVFVGDNEDFWKIQDNNTFSKSLKLKRFIEVFGPSVINKFALNGKDVKYVRDQIFHDDIVLNVIKKVHHYGSGEVYCKIKYSQDAFLNSVFRDFNFVTYEVLKKAYNEATHKKIAINTFGKDLVSRNEALSIIGDIKNIFINISKKYVDGIWDVFIPELSSEIIDTNDDTIESFKMKNNCLIVYDNKPFVTSKNNHDDASDKMKMITSFASNVTLTGQINFIHYRIKKSVGSNVINMFKVFAEIILNANVPFIKWISSTKTHFKVHGSFTNKELLKSWTKFENIKHVKTNNEIIVMKIPIPNEDILATIVVFSNGIYDVKINFRVGRIFSAMQIRRFAIYASQEMCKMIPIFFPLEDEDEFKIIASGQISDNEKQVTGNKLQKAIDLHMKPIFSIMNANETEVNLIYKRGRKFQNETNALKFLNSYYNTPEQDLINKLKDLFNLTLADATQFYKNWSNANKMQNGKVFIKQSKFNLITVRIISTKLNYKFIIDGATNSLQLNRITHALKYAISKGRDSKSEKYKGVVMKQVVDDSNSDDEDGFDLDLDLDLDLELDFGFDNDNESDNDDIDKTDFNAAEMKQNMRCPIKVGGAKDGWDGLESLYNADKDLFKFESEEGENKKKTERNYAKTCQKVSERQPIVTNKLELDYNKKCFPGAVTGSVNYGTTPELAAKNNYWCPKIWCPKSRVGLTMDQYNDYGKKCPFPNVKETPIIFDDQSYWNGKPRYIGYLKQTQHPKQFCMPCCFKKPLQDTKKECNQIVVGNDKYIKTESYPVEEKRYGLLPEILSKFFGNKFCGGKDGAAGLMGTKTDCFLRYGIQLTSQSFLQALVQSLDNEKINTLTDIINSIVQNVDMPLFISCHDGLLCKRFMDVRVDSIHNLASFNKFKIWFMGSKNASYIKQFNLTFLVQFLTNIVSFENIELLKYSKIVLREFKLYNALLAFQEYMFDENIKKKHDVLIYLVSIQKKWMNKNGYNIIVIEEYENTYAISCPTYSCASKYFNKERPILLFLKQGQYYEPIHYAKFNMNGDRGITSIIKTHNINDNTRIAKIVQLYLNTCKCTDSNKQDQINIFLIDEIDSYIINFDMHVIAFALKNNMVIPLKSPMPIDYNQKKKYVFMDTFIKMFKNDDPNLNKESIKSKIESINKFLNEKYYSIERTASLGKQAAVKLRDCSMYIPIVTYSEVKKSMIYKEIIRDGAIFIGYEKNDPRKDFIDKTSYIENLKIFMWNEVINIIKNNHNAKKIEELIHILRHPSNPMPKHYKRLELKGEIGIFLKRVIFKGSDDDFSKDLNSRICSTISNQQNCTNQCKYIYSKIKKSSHCKLSIPGKYYDLILEKCIEDLLNPLVRIEVHKAKNTENQRILSFTDEDVKKHGIDYILNMNDNNKLGNFDFENKMVKLTNDFNKIEIEKIDDSKILGKDPVLDVLPVFLRDKLKEFNLISIKDFENWIFEFFTIVQNMVYPGSKMTLEQVIGFSSEDIGSDDIFNFLENLCHGIGINCFLVTRQVTENPDRIRCMGKHNIDFFVLINMSKKNEFQVFVKNRTKFLFTMADFPYTFKEFVKYKCIKARIN